MSINKPAKSGEVIAFFSADLSPNGDSCFILLHYNTKPTVLRWVLYCCSRIINPRDRVKGLFTNLLLP